MNNSGINEIKYTEVTLFYEFKDYRAANEESEEQIVNASSGIYLLNKDGKIFIFSIIEEKIDFNYVEDLNVKYTCDALIEGNKVKWHAIPVNRRNFQSIEIESIDLTNFFSISNQEEKIPKKYLVTIQIENETVDVDNFKTNEELQFFKINRSKWGKKVPKSIRIESSPFGLSTVDLFSRYTTFGHINYESKNGEFWLSDCKFMDNMNGGIVMIGDEKTLLREEHESIGLVWGNIKYKGRGELMIIVSWNTLLNNIGIYNDKNSEGRECQSDGETIENEIDDDSGLSSLVEDAYKKVVGLKIRDKYGLISWGSGVIVANDMIITNKHVITGSVTNNQLPESIEIKFNNGADEFLTFKIENPKLYEEILMSLDKDDDRDVAFINCLTCDDEDKCGFSEIEGIKFVGGDTLEELSRKEKEEDFFVSVGEQTISIGYGLFYDGESQKLNNKPLQSVGRVTKINGGYDMILNSSSCWSGCSGGAVVNVWGELVAMMVNNVKVVESGEVLERINMAAGGPLLGRCLQSLGSLGRDSAGVVAGRARL